MTSADQYQGLRFSGSNASKPGSFGESIGVMPCGRRSAS